MITANEQKKLLVQQLLDSKSITIEQAYMLLDEPAPFFGIDYSESFPQPVYPYDWSKVYVGTPLPGQQPTTISYGTAGTSTLTVENITTDTVHYTPEQWSDMLRSGRLSNTSAQC